MNNDLLNILSHSNKDIDNQKLMDYVAGKLSAEENHEVEKQMVNNEFINDAVEGLSKLKNKKEVEALVEQMNLDLEKKLKQKRTRKEKRSLKEYPWIYLAIIIILALIILAYYVFHRLEQR